MRVFKKILLLSVVLVMLLVFSKFVLAIESIAIVSTDSTGVQGNDKSQNPSISQDAKYVAFESQSDNLVEEDSNSNWDVFIKEADTGKTARVSTNSEGNEGNGRSRYPSVSADGRYVSYDSDAKNLVADDGNSRIDVFVKDTETNQTIRVSTDSSGEEGNKSSKKPSISSNGRFVAFESDAQNLIGDGADNNTSTDIFVNDTQTNKTSRVSTSSAGSEVDDDSYNPSMSADGRYVAFRSKASNLVDDDTNTKDDVFVKDTQTGTTTRVSTNSAGLEGNNESRDPSISTDGRFVAFRSKASNLVDDDTNSNSDIFVKDLQTNTISRESTDLFDLEGNGDSYYPSISSDGRYLAFRSRADNLVDDDSNERADIFVKDRQDGDIIRVSTDASGNEANNDSTNPSVSSESIVAFESKADNLLGVGNDVNGIKEDVFLAQAYAEFNEEIDESPPTNPILSSQSHLVGIWSNDNTVNVNWAGAIDESGIGGYSVIWSQSPQTLPDTVVDLNENQSSTISPSLADGSWYFHLRTVDIYENWTSTAHIGPFNIDRSAPSNSLLALSASNYYKGVISMSASAMDSLSGIVKIEYFLGNKLISSLSSNPAIFNWDSSGYNGKATIKTKSTDRAGNESALSSQTINVDNYRPRTYAKKSTAKIKKRRRRRRRRRRGLATARLRWKVVDPYTGKKAKVNLRIQKRLKSKSRAKKKARYKKLYLKNWKLYRKSRNKKLKRRYKRRYRKYKKAYRKVKAYGYKTVKQANYGLTTINRWRTYKFKTRSKGKYRFIVKAKDRAGNIQKNTAVAPIVIK